ncbi:MAG: TlpA disulfide reductase family protein [Acidobacteriota bacterium]|jgi:peroxiredoxin
MSTSRSTLFLAAAGVSAALLIGGLAPTTADPGLQEQIAALDRRVDALEADLAAVSTRVRTNHPDPSMERAAAQALNQINGLVAGGNVAEAKVQMEGFLEEYGSTQAARQARSMAMELAAVGKPAPGQWSIERWYQGESDIDLQGQGPTLLVFWETWCPHCKREVPQLEQTFERYQPQGLQVLALTRQTRGATDESVESFIAEHGLQFPVAKETGALSAHFAVSGIPAAAVVKDGKVVWRGHPARLSDAMLESWLQ